VYETSQNTPEILDLLVGTHWPLVRRGSRDLMYAMISDDGSQVVALDKSTLVAWKLDLPFGAAATKAWLDELTNATAELGPTTVTWH
jgi:hypothetical protein